MADENKNERLPFILLAEDSDDDAYFFQRAARKSCAPCSVKRVANGRQAIEFLQSVATAPPDLLFLDLKMPVMSGFEVLHWLKDAELARSITVVVLSGSNDEADRIRAMSLGASEYMVKPIQPEELGARIRSVAASRETTGATS